jgi:hypothetical protein
MWTPSYYPLEFSFPALGETFRLAVRDALSSAGCAVMITAQLGALPVGGTCTLYTDTAQIFLFASTSSLGVAELPITLPTGPALLGVDVFAQWAIADPAGAFLGGIGTLSDAQHILIGRR